MYRQPLSASRIQEFDCRYPHTATASAGSFPTRLSQRHFKRIGRVGSLRHTKKKTPRQIVRNSENIIRKSKCSTDFKRNDFLKKNEAYPLGALRSLKFAYRKLRISLFVELAV